jgi:hypothetical protein
MNELIYSYTRAQAIEDGVLVDVSELAREAGFRIPVAVTRAVWCQCIEVCEEDAGQDETGRLWDILNVLRSSVPAAGKDDVLHFDVLIAKGGNLPRRVGLKSHCGPGDNLEPVITLMMPDED